MKNLLTFIIAALVAMSTYAQVDDIKDNAEKNRKGGISSGGNPSDSNIDGDACFEPCADIFCGACFDLGIQVFGALLADHHDYIMKNIDVNPLPMSFEIRPNFGYNVTHQSLQVTPSIRGNLGVYSTDIRYMMIAEYDSYGANIYDAWEWQLAIINLIPSEYVAFHFGSGLYYETHTGNLYNEHYAAFDVNSTDQALVTRVESRFALDYAPEAVNMLAMTEVNWMTGYRILKNDVVYLYLFGGINYQQFYGSVSTIAIQTGMLFNIH